MTATNLAQNLERQSNAKEERKLRKPLIERKRRERINNCLDQLKETVVGAFRLDQSKLEKADILEMTVKHLQNIQSNKLNDSSLDVEAQQKYSTGYIQCMHEVHNLLLSCDWMDKTLGSRLLNHLLRSLPRSPQDRSQQTEPTAPLCENGRLARNYAHGLESPRASPLSPPLPRAKAAQSLEDRCPTPSNRPCLSRLEMWRPW